jgi:hypothetical protein
MSARSGRRWKGLLIGGVLAASGMIGTLVEGTHAALYVPVCQPGAHWIREGSCAVLWYRVLAMELLLGLGVAIVVLDLVRRAHARWRMG